MIILLGIMGDELPRVFLDRIRIKSIVGFYILRVMDLRLRVVLLLVIVLFLKESSLIEGR